MIYMIFEVTPKEGRMPEYLDLAARLRDDLLKCPGFVRAERFTSMSEGGKLLSLSVWESDTALSEWRNRVEHRLSQLTGRDSLFEGFSITVASGIRSYTGTERIEAPEDSNRYHGIS
ncbi:MAG: antibiotic biosynthesis monooxygenase [Deltaproteobacteria bacterium]|nr:antibiotic biosynthesis monooxygenase [Deltaproteobacteria bacterium]